MQYSKKVIQHFQKPHNQGQIKNPDAVGQVGNPACGDIMKIYLKIKNQENIKTLKQKNKKTLNQEIKKSKNQENKKTLNQEEIISDIKFETMGCAAAIAVSSILTDLVKKKTLAEALKVDNDKIIKELGGLPSQKIHCSMLAVDALKDAIDNYRK